MTSMTILKKLKTIYWRALGSKKWHIALQVLERQAKYAGLFEKQSRPPQYSSEVTYGASMTELKHPPPAHV